MWQKFTNGTLIEKAILIVMAFTLISVITTGILIAKSIHSGGLKSVVEQLWDGPNK